MNKKIFISIFFLCFVGVLFANPAVFDAAEELRAAGDRQGAFDLLKEGLKFAGSNREKAEFYWRMSETYLNMGDDLEDTGASEQERLSLYEQGEAYADQAIGADSTNHIAYFQKSANIGRWGQTKGILSSLFKADDMKETLIAALRQNEEYADAWHVLGMIYAAVPGRPISFGNVSYAISLSRKAYDARVTEVQSGIEEDMGVGVMKELALQLWDRDWSASKRRREQNKMQGKFDSIGDFFEKNLFYEGTVSIPNKEDRDEAIDVMTLLVNNLRSKRNRTHDEDVDLEELTEILNDWR